MRNLLVAFALCVACIGHAAPKKEKLPPTNRELSIAGQPTKLHFELRSLGAEPYERWREVPAEVRVTRPSGEVVQVLQVEIGVENPWFEFIDINDDGYVDLLLYDACAGFATCAGPTVAADVFLYAPKLGRFVKSKTMSGRGELRKSKTRSCVEVTYKNGSQTYATEEWCFNLKTGRWRQVSFDRGEIQGE